MKNNKKLVALGLTVAAMSLGVLTVSLSTVAKMDDIDFTIELPKKNKIQKPLVDGIKLENGAPKAAGVSTILDMDIEIDLENLDVDNSKVDATLIRCTGYNDIGYTRSGEWTRPGVIAGKYEWLGKSCNLYRQNDDGSIGELIGTYEFLDTGYGINGSLEKGTSIDVWHPTEDAVWDWMAEYGDYVYIEFI